MNELDVLKKHHEEFRGLIAQIRLLLEDESIGEVAQEVMDLISHLNAQLMVHLTMEDRHVYPLLMDCENDRVRELAEEFKSEVGHLFGEFQKYRLKWTCAAQVIVDPDGFLADTETIFAVINKRMVLEDDSLYLEAASLSTC